MNISRVKTISLLLAAFAAFATAHAGTIHVAPGGTGAGTSWSDPLGCIMRHFARLSRGDVWISDDGIDPGHACDFIAFSHFREAGRICLQNVDFDTPRTFTLHRFGIQEPVTLAPGEFRLLDAATGATLASDPGGERAGV